MRNKIVVFSFSKIGYQIAKMMHHKNYEIIIVENNPQRIEKIKSLGYTHIDSDLMDDEDIIKLGITDDKSIKAFFCVSDEKNTNLFVTLSVRNLNPMLKIISVSFSKEDDKTMILAGANKVINPYEIGALRIFRHLHKPFLLDVMDNILFSDSDIQVSEILIEKGSIFDGVMLHEIDVISKHNLIILGIQDKEISEKFIFYSGGKSHKVDHGDTLVILGRTKEIENFKKCFAI